jgi:response regulator NasT
MKRSLRIVVADDERNMAEFLQKGLPLLGHEVVAVAQTGRELVERCLTSRPDLVVTDIKMPDMDGLDAAAAIYQCLTIPIIIVSAYYDPELIERAGRNHIASYLVKPIKQGDLETAITLAVRRFEEFQALHQEAADLRQALEDRKLIERAKGILMKKGGLEEQEAFRRLQQLSRNKNRKMSEIAQIILMAEEAYEPPASS